MFGPIVKWENQQDSTLQIKLKMADIVAQYFELFAYLNPEYCEVNEFGSLFQKER